MSSSIEPRAASKRSGVFALLVGLASIALSFWWMQRDPPPPPPEPGHPPFLVPVTVSPVVVGDVREEVELVGDVRSPERARVAFERPGRLRELEARLGDVVKRGDVLARLDDSVMNEEVNSSEAELNAARELAALAARDSERAHEVAEVGMSEAAIDRADAIARNEAARVVQLEADLALQKARLAQGTLKAPFDAVVTERPVSPGDYVDAGDVCFELLSLERREILLEIPLALLGSVRPGARVTLRSDALEGFSLTAELGAVLSSAEPRARTFQGVVRVDCSADPEGRLQPGLFIRALVTAREAIGALVVPVDAILEGPNGTSLARLIPGPPASTAILPVEILARDASRAAVRSIAEGDAGTLAAGDSVVLTGKENVFPGASVLVVETPSAAKESEGTSDP
jgi:RND family efflux transporter MFP subunit